MGNKTSRMRGFTLIASLLVLVLLSGVSIGLMYLVNSQQHIGSNDMEDNLAFYGAESGMEKMTSDLAALYSAVQAPTQAQISGVAAAANWPTVAEVGPMIYTEAINRQLDLAGVPVQRFTTISSGPEQGLSALTIPINMQVSATRPGSNASVNMFRTVEVALIPVFQFGVFCSGDCSYFAGPHFGFQGRVHTNGNLFLAANNGPLVIDGKITAFGEIIRDRLANDWTGGGYQGSVYIPTQTGGCTPWLPAASGNPPAGSPCVDFGPDTANGTNDASWSGGIPPAGAANADPLYAAWLTASASFYGFITNRINGAKLLSLPFVQVNNPALGSSAQQIQIIRKATGTDSVPLANSKLYNKASIRILLADTQALLHPERPLAGADGQDIDLTQGSNVNGYQIKVGANWTRVAMATAGGPIDPAWKAPPNPSAFVLPDPLLGGTNWNLINGWIRVEYLNNANPPVWVGITNQWLGYGFARGTTIPIAPGTNAVHANAILILQEQRPGAAVLFDGAAGLPSPNPANSGSKYSWYPINFWDPREGLARDNAGALVGTQCNVNGVMNAVELDVGNLNQWLQGLGPVYGAGAGLQVNSTAQNGYVLYFSDRRGMIADPNVAGVALVNGEYGFEDVINRGGGAANGPPDGLLEPVTPGYNLDRSNNVSYSPEDSDENGLLDDWGAQNVGNGFQSPGTANPVITSVFPYDPYQAVDCLNGGMQNIVTGARHVLKLVDGSLGNLPMARPPAVPAPSGGFTVASENPVYVEGDYNSNAADTVWNTPSVNDPVNLHAAAAVIADSVSLLSNQPTGVNPNGWTDQKSMNNSLNLNGRLPVPTYYRMAIAAGKNMNFPQIGGADFGTDGGVHNFLRLLENWGGVGLFYRGSMVSLYYSQYATGTFKCCTEVYGAPTRNFYFDTDFRNPNNLPPGTPMLQDINNLSERQDFTPQ